MGARHDRGVEPGILAGWMEVGMRLGRAADDDFILLGRQSQNTDFEGTFGFGEQANDNYDTTHEITPRRCEDIGNSMMGWEWTKGYIRLLRSMMTTMHQR